MRTTLAVFMAGLVVSGISAKQLSAHEACLNSVSDQLSRVDRRGKKLEFWLHHKFPGGTTKLPEGLSDRSMMKHIQGVARLPYRNVLVLSGNAGGGSYLYAVRMGTQPDRGEWTRNVACSGKRCQVPGDDEMISVTHLSAKYHHPGGIQAFGDIVAVGVDYKHGKPSFVRFFDYKDPARPRELIHARIFRKNLKADAVAITRVPSGWHKGKLLVVVHSNRAEQLDFYLSNGSDLRDPSLRFELHASWRAKARHMKLPHYQAIHLVAQCDGALYLFGTIKTKPFFGLPWGGKDWLHAYQVELDAFDADRDPVTGNPNPFLIRTDEKHFKLKTSYFSAGAGVFVDPWDGALRVYATDYWPVRARTTNTTLRFEVFE